MLKRKIIFSYFLFVFVGIITFLIFFQQIEQDIDQNNISDYQIMIPVLPEQVQKSFNKIIDEAEEKYQINYRFNLNFVDLYSENVITSSTPLILKLYEQNKNEKSSYILKMPSSFTGLTLKQLENILDNNWNINEYKADKKLVLATNISDFYKFSNEKFLGIKDGYIAVYERKNDQEILLYKTEIAINKLPEKEKEDLEKGIEVKDKEELLTLLEGLLGYIKD